MKCPVCQNPLREKGAGNMTLDICYGGCGGIWFDRAELESVSARAATTLHSIWQAPVNSTKPGAPRSCPRCSGQLLDRKWFSPLRRVEIDECPMCGGIWLDAGEFSRIYDEISGAKIAPPGWATAMAEAAALLASPQSRPSAPPA